MADVITQLWQVTTMLAVGIFLVMRFLNRTKALSGARFWPHVQPVLPPVLGVAGAFLGGISFEAHTSILQTIIHGLFAAYAAEKAHKVLGQSVLGDDARINRREIDDAE